MPRPSQVVVEECYEDEGGGLHIWAKVDGVESFFVIGGPWRQTLDAYKLRYGFADIEQHSERIGEKNVVPGDRVIVDKVPNADARAWECVFAEHFDRWAQYGLPVGGHEPDHPTDPHRPPERPSRSGKMPRSFVRRRPDLELTHRPPPKTPTPTPGALRLRPAPPKESP